MKIGVVIPTRGDRPEYLELAKYMLSYQTIQADVVKIVDFKPEAKGVFDIKERYMVGINYLIANECDVIFCWEDDDYYSPKYIETMLRLWKGERIFGINSTVYYDIKKRRYVKLKHHGRASMMSTLFSKEGALKINWNFNEDRFVDIHLWKTLSGRAIEHSKDICIGIKHGEGLCAGIGHKKDIYNVDDSDLKYLKKIDKHCLKFYESRYMYRSVAKT